MRKKIYFTILLITATIPYLASAEEPVNFADANLKTVVEEALDVIDPTPTDMLRLTHLSAHERGISDLTGLEHAINLQTVGFCRNQINDLSALSGLNGLSVLSIFNNQISDLSPITDLTSLYFIELNDNQISDISALSGLIRLERLDLSNNFISDISALSKLTSLQWLPLSRNQIIDISPLSNLANLQVLSLLENQISDISVLSNLTSLQNVILSSNQIIDISALSGLTNLQTLWLTNNQISDISPLSQLVSLQELLLSYNQISDLSPLSELMNLEGLYLWRNPLGIDAYTIHIPLFESYGTTVYYDPLVWRKLIIVSTVSGLFIEPGEGDFYYTNLTVVNINAEVKPGYYFVNWAGSAVNAGKVADPAAVATTVTMDANYTLQANFKQIQFGLYVDDDAPNDPGRGDPQISDENEDGSWEHPFDTIQEAIYAAEDSFTVLVYPGMYLEEVNFLGKAITVQGVATSAGIPVLENPDGIAVSFYYSEGPDSVLMNFVIRNSVTSVYIVGSSPTISNITFVDNKYGIINFGQANPHITNSIFWNNLKNDLFQCHAYYSCIERGGEGEGNINIDPLFVDPNKGDYHLRSKRGRYWQEHNVWILDNSTSPCIDAGDPLTDPSTEPLPNGGRINMGAYGGTAFASMSE